MIVVPIVPLKLLLISLNRAEQDICTIFIWNNKTNVCWPWLSCFYFKPKANCKINFIHTIILNGSWTWLKSVERLTEEVSEWTEEVKGRSRWGEQLKNEKGKNWKTECEQSQQLFCLWNKTRNKVCQLGERGGGERENEWRQRLNGESQDGNMRGPVSIHWESLMHPEPLYKYHKEWMMSRGRGERRGRNHIRPLQ